MTMNIACADSGVFRQLFFFLQIQYESVDLMHKVYKISPLLWDSNLDYKQETIGPWKLRQVPMLTFMLMS